jgi:hypothetical protein
MVSPYGVVVINPPVTGEKTAEAYQRKRAKGENIPLPFKIKAAV